MLTQSLLKEVLHYDEATGVFTWRVGRGGVRAGSVAGSLHWSGYVLISIYGRQYAAHRLAWLYAHGELPPDHLDHINHNKSENQLSNLRPATRAQNQKNRLVNSNNTSGFRGVVWHKMSERWLARAMLNGKRPHLGLFHTAEAAADAYERFAREHHGEFYLPTGISK